MNASALSRLPTPLRRRVGTALVSATVVAIGIVAVLGALFHEVVWTQARAEVLVGSQPHVSGTYAWWEEEVTLDDGPTLPLWRSTNAYWGPDDGAEVDVVVFPGEDRAFLVSDVPTGDVMIFQRSVDWLLLVYSGTSLILTLLAALYGVVRLVLGFTPLALPSLLRRRGEVNGVVDGYWPAPTAGRGVLRLTLGADSYGAGVALRGEQPRPGDPITMGGSVQPDGWMVGWTDRGVVVLREPLRADVPVPRP